MPTFWRAQERRPCALVLLRTDVASIAGRLRCARLIRLAKNWVRFGENEVQRHEKFGEL